MGEILAFEKVKLIVGVLYSSDSLFNEALADLIQEFGETDLISEAMNFEFTQYYNDEIGDTIYKRIISFKSLICPTELSTIKISTNQMEERWQTTDKRPINLDPGILDLSHLVLATTKNRGHRIALEKGIYGELTLLYMNGGFVGQPWTYADFNTDDYKAVLIKVRDLYRKQRKEFL